MRNLAIIIFKLKNRKLENQKGIHIISHFESIFSPKNKKKEKKKKKPCCA
jgi:hypothetical protein